MFKLMAHKIFRHFGFDVVRYTKDNFYDLKRKLIIKKENINLVLDIGASEGNYAMALRSMGYNGRIISFEPLSVSFIALKNHSKKDPLWHIENLAIGDYDGESEINISGRITSSSLLPIMQSHINVYSESAYIAKEKIKVARIDTFLFNKIKPSDNIFLKADVQGYEKKVLLGAAEILTNVRALELELSFIPLYDGVPFADDMLLFLKDRNFTPAAFRPVLTDPVTEQMLQVDCLFVRQK